MSSGSSMRPRCASSDFAACAAVELTERSGRRVRFRVPVELGALAAAPAPSSGTSIALGRWKAVRRQDRGWRRRLESGSDGVAAARARRWPLPQDAAPLLTGVGRPLFAKCGGGCGWWYARSARCRLLAMHRRPMERRAAVAPRGAVAGEVVDTPGCAHHLEARSATRLDAARHFEASRPRADAGGSSSVTATSPRPRGIFPPAIACSSAATAVSASAPDA